MSDDAGLCRFGDVERMRRLGDAPTGSMRGLPRGDALRSGGDIGGEGSSVCADVVVVVLLVVVDAAAAAVVPVCSIAGRFPSSPFFFLSPNSFFPLPRMLLLSAGLAWRKVVVADAGGLGSWGTGAAFSVALMLRLRAAGCCGL